MIWSDAAQGWAERAVVDSRAAPHRPTLVTDLGGRIVAVSRSWTTMCQFSAEETLGRSPKLLQGELTDAEGAAAFAMILRQGAYSPCASLVNYKKDRTAFVNSIAGWQVGDLLVAETFADRELPRGADGLVARAPRQSPGSSGK